MTIRTFITSIVTATAALTSEALAAAPSIAEARELITAGDYESAITMLNELAAKEPRNTTIPQLLGDCYRALGNDTDAKAQYNKVVAKNNNARLGLIDIAIREYRLDDADKLLEDYRKGLGKGRRARPDESETVTGQLERTRSMLNRVEKIEVFDSINVPADEFFKHYRLSPECGSLNPASVLPPDFPSTESTVVYEPESRTEMMWAAPGADESYKLVSSVALYGNEWDTPRAVGDHLGEGGDAGYPFLMPDGITLYFANDGENSLGGYDIFISRRNGDGFLQPQNLGMPYNSPYNDYMLVIDESTGVGWWASDRNRIEGMVTIYLFKPLEMRVNVDVTAPDLIDRARLTSISSTWEPDADYSELIQAIANISSESYSLRPQCLFGLPDGRVITRVEQLHNADARMALRHYIDLENSMKDNAVHLESLRRTYASGDTSVGPEILRLEKQALDDAVTLRHASNEVIEAEMQ